jgi:hypothetical protein
LGLREDAARGVAGTSLGSADAEGGAAAGVGVGVGVGVGLDARGVCSTYDSDKDDSRGCRSPLGRLE